MTTMETGFGGEVSIERGAGIVALISSAILFVLFVLLGQDPILTLAEVTVGGVVMGTMYYLGLRVRA